MELLREDVLSGNKMHFPGIVPLGVPPLIAVIVAAFVVAFVAVVVVPAVR